MQTFQVFKTINKQMKPSHQFVPTSYPQQDHLHKACFAKKISTELVAPSKLCSEDRSDSVNQSNFSMDSTSAESNSSSVSIEETEKERRDKNSFKNQKDSKNSNHSQSLPKKETADFYCDSLGELQKNLADPRLAALRLTVSRMSEMVFRLFDFDKNGFLDAKEAKLAIIELFESKKVQPPDDQTLGRLIKFHDKDGNGRLDLKEFKQLLFDIYQV